MIDNTIVNACLLSCLSYLQPDIFYLKWNAYKNVAAPLKENCNNFYCKREQYINKFFYGVENMPLFYDGSTNVKLSRDAQAYFVHKDDIQYVCFRGTSSFLDVGSDLDFMQVCLREPCDKTIKVHRGFYMQFLSVKDDIFADLDPGKRIVFCGHSAGAAIACLAAFVYRLEHGDHDVSCITFGSPYTGNVAFADFFKKVVTKHWRFTTQSDIVPYISLGALYDYKHVDDAICLGDSKAAPNGEDYKPLFTSAHWVYKAYRFLIKLVKPVYMHSTNIYFDLVSSYDNNYNNNK